MADTLGEKIRHYRKLKNYSQEMLAEKTELSKMSIRRYESGERQPGIEALKKIATALDCQVSDIDENIIIVPIPKFSPTPEDIERYTKDAEARKLIKKMEAGETLTTEEQQKIIDYDKQLKFEAKQREEAAKNAPKFFILDENGNKVKCENAPRFTDVSSSREEAQAREKAFNIFNSLLDEGAFSSKREAKATQLGEILTSYSSLNDIGKEEAAKRIEELTEIPRYTKQDEPITYVKAAHAIEGATEEDKKVDEDIMKNF